MRIFCSQEEFTVIKSHLKALPQEAEGWCGLFPVQVCSIRSLTTRCLNLFQRSPGSCSALWTALWKASAWKTTDPWWQERKHTVYLQETPVACLG